MFNFKRPTVVANRGNQTRAGTVRRHSKGDNAQKVTAGDLGLGSPTNPGWNVNRFNPVFDRLEQGAVYEDWVPRNGPDINMMFRRIAHRDPIVGRAIDIWSTLPWSTFDIVGVQDPAIRKFYEDAFNWWTIDLLGQVSKEYLIIGRFAGSLLYNEQRGYWDNMIPWDPDFLDITPIQFPNADPKIDLKLTPGFKNFLNSSDERDVFYKNLMPPEMIQQLLTTQKVALDPLKTLFLARKTAPHDYIGTSLLTRIIPLWAVEKPLQDAMAISARRRASSILHLQAGIDNLWEATPDEIDSYTSLFIQADEDPTGAVVGTRNGIQISEVRQGGAIWKWSDEMEFLIKAKMRALGVSDAFFEGTASYNNTEQAKSVFVEQVINFRQTLTHQIFYKKAEILARAHGFKKRTQAELDHNIRIENKEVSKEDLQRRLKFKKLSARESMKIPKDELILPIIHWHKELKANQDEKLIDMFKTLEEKLGVPLPVRMWAASVGISLDDLMPMYEEDAKLRETLKKLTETKEKEEEKKEEPKLEASFRPLRKKRR